MDTSVVKIRYLFLLVIVINYLALPTNARLIFDINSIKNLVIIPPIPHPIIPPPVSHDEEEIVVIKSMLPIPPVSQNEKEIMVIKSIDPFRPIN